jgi:methionyl-tRNA formyltransferase
LIREERETGLTLHFLDEGIDSGDIVYQQTQPITDADTPGTLADKIKAYAGPMVRRALNQIAAGETLPRTPQDSACATLAPRLRPDALRIQWNQPARAVWSFIRGTSQKGLGARAWVDGREVIIMSCAEHDHPATTPGQVIAADTDQLLVSCADRCVIIPRRFVEPAEVGIIQGMTLT